MTTVLSHNDLATNEASVEDRLRACGAQLWPTPAVKKYQQKQEAKLVRAFYRNWLMSEKSLRSMFYVVIFSIVLAVLISWKLSFVIGVMYLVGKGLHAFDMSPEWHTNTLNQCEFNYARDNRMRHIPPTAVQLVKNILRIFPRAEFAVQFVGYDPILDCRINGKVYCILVWDENRDGSITVVPPPAD